MHATATVRDDDSVTNSDAPQSGMWRVSLPSVHGEGLGLLPSTNTWNGEIDVDQHRNAMGSPLWRRRMKAEGQVVG